MPLLGKKRGASMQVGRRATAAKSSSAMGRSKSAPCVRSNRHIKGIMKFTSVEESLHSKYGEGNGESKCTSSDNSSNGSATSGQRRIVFHEILVREYARTVGDNPSCSSGPPVTIAWDYNPETKIVSIDQYEELRPPRRTHFEMILPRTVRQSMLRKEWDVTQNQIAAAVRANIKAKNQRRSTINNLGKATKMEEMFESAGRKVKRGLMFKKSISKQVEELEEQMSIMKCVQSQHDMQIMMKDEYDDDDDDGQETLVDSGADVDAAMEIEGAGTASGDDDDNNNNHGPSSPPAARQQQRPLPIKIEEPSSDDEEEDDGSETGGDPDGKTIVKQKQPQAPGEGSTEDLSSSPELLEL